MKYDYKITTEARHRIAKLLAAALLTQRRQISYTEIEALPAVQDASDVEEVVMYLLTTLKAKKSVVKKDDYPILGWDTILTLT